MDVKHLKFALIVSAFSLLAAPVMAQGIAGDAAAAAKTGTPAPAPKATDAPATPAVPAPLPSAATMPPSTPAPTPDAAVKPAPTADGDATAAMPPALVDVQPPATEPATETAIPAEPECEMERQEITSLREPRFGSANVWDLLDGGDGMDVYADVLPLENDFTIAAGSFTKDKADNTYHPLIVKFDQRLKKVWEVRVVTPDYKTIHRILKTKEGFTVLGDVQDKARGNGLYLGFYDEAGKPKGEMPIFESGGSLDGKSLLLASDATGYIVAAQFTDGKDNTKQHGILYKLSKSGKQIWKRSYQPGMTTVFQNAQATLDGQYLLTGQIVTEDNKSGGWMLRVDNKGAIGWQHTYPRGLAASLQSAAPMKDGSLIVTGKIRPLSGANTGLAAWIMKTDSTGTPIWQRYFKSPSYDYGALDAIVYEDGRASVLIGGAGMDHNHRSHARLMTFSPQGKIQQLEDFSEGQNAVANRLVSGLNGERLFAGYAQTSFGEHQEGADPAPDYTYDGWIVAGTVLDLYNDPCAPPVRSSPILP